MVDAAGDEHLFVDKVPMVTLANLHEASLFPQPGFIACTIIERYNRDDGRQVVHIDTHRPWSIESTVGRSKFEVFAEQLSHHARDADSQ
jgi:hypothetical protein